MKRLPFLLLAATLLVAGCAGTQQAATPSGETPSGAAMTASADATDIRTTEYPVSEITYPELPDFEIPAVERFTLENGMTVFLIEDHELPEVSASARIGAGSVYEPAEKVGLASMTGQVMRTGGTESMTSDEINQQLEDLGATVETSIGETSGSAYMNTLSENTGQVLPIFADVLANPAFAEEKVALAKSQAKSSIARRNDNPSGIVSREFDKLLYGPDSPYARTTEYTTIDNITRRDLAGFHGQYFHPSNVILSVWGDFDTAQMKQQLQQAFGSWASAPGFDPPTAPQPEGERNYSVSFVQKDDVNQSIIRMGYPGELTQDDPDYFPVIVMNEVLSGGFTSRLFQSVRTDQGLAYSVFGQYTAGYDRPGIFIAQTQTKSETTVEAAQSVLSEIEKLRSAPPTENEVQLAKDSYLNSFVFNFDTRSEILGRLMTYEAYGYPADFLQQIKDGVEQVTPQDVYRVAQKYLHPDQVDILVLGRQQDFSEPLSALTQGGEVNEVDITIPSGAPGAGEEEAPASEADLAAGRDRLMQVVGALGGAEAFSQVENMKVASATQAGGQTIESALTVKLPNQIRADLTLPNGFTLTVVDDGEQMMLQGPQGTQPAPPQLRQQVGGQVQRNLAYLMTQADNPDLEVADQGMVDVDGAAMPALRITPPGGEAFTLLLDPETMRPARMRYQSINPQTGAPVAAEDVYSDYQTEAGIAVPFTTVTYQDGEEAGTTTISSLEVNAPLEEGLFSVE